MQPFEQNLPSQNGIQQILFSTDSAILPIHGKKVSIDLQDGNITCDAGVLILYEIES